MALQYAMRFHLSTYYPRKQICRIYVRSVVLWTRIIKEEIMNKYASFGGNWTQDKLQRLDKYLRAYTKIFHTNPRARYLTTTYVDAFASTGSIAVGVKSLEKSSLPPELDEPEAQEFLKGSARIALEVEPAFNHYLFIERDAGRAKELETLKALYPSRSNSIQVENAEANKYLEGWFSTTDWSSNRAVLFLDPYGMQVEWSLLEAIAHTHAIDVWLLFPIGMGVNRLLTRNQLPPSAWAERITKTLGTSEWIQEFYPIKTEPTLFGDIESQGKDTDFARIADYFVRRLKTLFPDGVAENPLLLRNSNNVPLYLLCFATGSQKDTARNAAKRIAQDILRR